MTISTDATFLTQFPLFQCLTEDEKEKLVRMAEFKKKPKYSFIYNPNAPEADPQIDITVYERTWEQNEEWGINDMKV